MSSRRSASAGTRIGTTARRWNRSSRNVPSAISRSRSRAGRRDDADVDVDPVGAADALEGLVDEDAQDLVLRLARHVADLVEIERAAVRLLERADLARGAVGGLGAEQLVLHALRRDRRGVEDDERPGRARATARGWCARPVPCRRPTAPEIMTRLLVGATFSISCAQVVHRRRAAEQLGWPRRRARAAP